MKVFEKGAPAAAIVAALSTLACCVPLGFLGALGLASVGVWIAPLRPWLLGAAVLLVVFGFIQIYRRRSHCAKPSRTSVVLFWVACGIVALVMLFPQLIAGWLAG